MTCPNHDKIASFDSGDVDFKDDRSKSNESSVLRNKICIKNTALGMMKI